MIRLHPHPWLDSGVWFQWLPKQSLTLKALIPGQCYGIWLLVKKKKKSSMSDLQGHWDHLALLKITSGEPRFGESKRGLTLAGAPRWTGECYRAGHWPWTMENFFSQKTWRPDFILQPMLPLLFWTTLTTTASTLPPPPKIKLRNILLKKKEEKSNSQLKYFPFIALLL